MAYANVKEFFDNGITAILDDPEAIKGMNASYQFSISGDGGGEWTLKLADGKGEVTEGTTEGVDCTVMATDENWLKIVNKSLNSQMAFMTGKLKIKGNMGLALKLQKFL